MAEQKGKAKGKRTADKWKRKKWFKIFAPPEFDRKEIGETPADKEKNLLGRTVKTTLGELTGERQKRHVVLKFRVNDVKGTQAFTEIVQHEIHHIYMNRMVRRRMSKIEAVQVSTTKDKKKVRIKTVALSQKKLNRKQETAIRNAIIKSIEKSAGKKDFSPLIQLIVFGVLASKLFKDLKKIAPLRRVEIVKSVVLEG
jgi:small subunit ribosomal protein S3Ae